MSHLDILYFSFFFPSFVDGVVYHSWVLAFVGISSRCNKLQNLCWLIPLNNKRKLIRAPRQYWKLFLNISKILPSNDLKITRTATICNPPGGLQIVAVRMKGLHAIGTATVRLCQEKSSLLTPPMHRKYPQWPNTTYVQETTPVLDHLCSDVVLRISPFRYFFSVQISKGRVTSMTVFNTDVQKEGLQWKNDDLTHQRIPQSHGMSDSGAGFRLISGCTSRFQNKGGISIRNL